uniref:Uncharacterized protein n=1 Tax=Rhizophora mucronata TaxID=61149 RepID=A0A2P2Q0A3_RHIMU
MMGFTTFILSTDFCTFSFARLFYNLINGKHLCTFCAATRGGS